MSLNRLLEENHRLQYECDSRPEPRTIEVVTFDSAELFDTVARAREQFRSDYKHMFRSGEQHAYADELLSVEKVVREDFLPKVEGRTVEYDFSCTPRPCAGARLNVKIDDLIGLKLFTQFYDTFSGLGYGPQMNIARNLSETIRIIRSFDLEPKK